MDIQLREISKSNWQEIAALKLDPSQKDYVFENSYSITESFFCENSVAKGIFLNDKAIGFIMYESLADEDKPDEVEFLRYMIDAEYQGKGFGKQAFAIALDDIKQNKKPKKIHICFAKENTAANRLYSKFGFVDNGIDEHGQINLMLQT